MKLESRLERSSTDTDGSYLKENQFKVSIEYGRGGGLVVCVLAFYSGDPSSNPTGYFNFMCKKDNNKFQKRPGLAHF